MVSRNAGDKPSSFVGSKQWIGAIELGYILDTLLGVSSKVITVSNGAEMASKAREIAHHFDSQVCTACTTDAMHLWSPSTAVLRIASRPLCPPHSADARRIFTGRWPCSVACFLNRAETSCLPAICCFDLVII